MQLHEKWKVADIVLDVFIWCKMRKKITGNYSSFGKMYPIKGYQIVIFNFEDISKIKIVLYQTLITFFHTSKPISSRMLVETSHIDGFYMLYGPLTLSGLWW